MNEEQNVEIDYHILLDVLPSADRPSKSFRDIYHDYCRELESKHAGTRMPSESLFRDVMGGVAALDSSYPVDCDKYDPETHHAIGETFSYHQNRIAA